MPEIQYYIVTETREVNVMATNAVDATLIAASAFKGEGPGPELVGVIGNVRSAVKTTSLNTEKE